ncbi:MAG TPA: DoxX family protein [Thermoanaerobaculia bacterium]
MNRERLGELTFLLLRIVVAVMFFQSGALKLFGWFGGMPPGVGMTPLIWTAAVMEVVGGVLIAVGLFTRPVAFLCSGEMAVAYFHGHFHLPGGFWPIQNHGELAVVYCFFFLYLWAHGPGPLSLDARRASRRANLRP